MLRCCRIVQMLADLISQELPLEYREMVEEHLRCCPTCAAFASSYRSVIDLARDLPDLPLPPAIRHRLRLKARELGVELPEDEEQLQGPRSDDLPDS